ncbi:MAG: cytochrome C [Blastocatellia bacterium]
MISQYRLKISILVAFVCGIAFYQIAQAQQVRHKPAPGDGKNMVVQLCDGKTNLTVKGVRPDERLTPEKAQAVSDEIMSLWLSQQDPTAAAKWAEEIAQAQKQNPQQQNPKPGTPPESMKDEKTVPKQDTGRGQLTPVTEQVADFSPRDHLIWDREVAREVEYGNQIFHDDKLIGSTNGIACAMCHPNASNTHPETYPKFQIQLKRVALLRDMINWCIENPARGKVLNADDPKMRALEAYILSQRKGVALEPGKH